MPGRDAFEERYTAGVLTEDHAPAEPSPLERGAVAQAMPAASLPMAMIAGSIAYARSDCYMQLTGGAGPEQLPVFGTRDDFDISYAARPVAQPPRTLADLRTASSPPTYRPAPSLPTAALPAMHLADWERRVRRHRTIGGSHG